MQKANRRVVLRLLHKNPVKPVDGPVTFDERGYSKVINPNIGPRISFLPFAAAGVLGYSGPPPPTQDSVPPYGELCGKIRLKAPSFEPTPCKFPLLGVDIPGDKIPP